MKFIVLIRFSPWAQTNTLFERELSSMNVSKPFSRFVHTTYDAVWSIALALKNAEQSWRNESKINKRKRKKLDFFDYTRKDFAKDFVEQFRRLKFQGISVIKLKAIWKTFLILSLSLQGPISFNGNDRIGITKFHQIQYAHLKPVAFFHPETEFLDFTCSSCSIIKWENDVVPIAKRVFKLRFATISRLAFFTVTSLAIFGIILSLMFLAFNLHFRKLK